MSAARSALRRLFKGYLIRRHLPAQFGSATLYVSPDASLRYLKPGRAAWDPALLRWATEYVRPGDIVWDIGANVGVFAFAAAGRGASVLAVEPDPFLANALLRGKTANPALQVQVLGAAVSDSLGLATLQISSGGRAANSLAGLGGREGMFGHTVAEITVPTVTLDSLLPVSWPSLVKIDVEGAEGIALAGAERLLGECRPVLLIEVGDECTDAVAPILERHRYRLFDGDEPFGPVDRPAYNTIAVPQ